MYIQLHRPETELPLKTVMSVNLRKRKEKENILRVQQKHDPETVHVPVLVLSTTVSSIMILTYKN
jgi:hypothetical protein